MKLLEPFRGQVPDEVFGEPYVPPVSDGSGQDRNLLRKAQQLLQVAGLPIKDSKRLLTGGEDHTAQVWDAATEKASGPLLRHPATVFLGAVAA